MPTPQTDTGSAALLLRVMRGLMRPLVRMLISHGVTAPAFYRMLKSVYVEVAHDEFGLDDKTPTDSRITLITGVHRRDVREILSSNDQTWQEARTKTVTFATVFSRWCATPAYLDETGQPRPLPRSGAADGVDFENLVRDVNRDIRPRTILDELMRQGIVENGEDGLLYVSQSAAIGPASSEDQMVFFAANLGDHVAAAASNLLSPEPQFLERAVFYNRLTPDAVDTLEASARTLSQTTLETLNAQSLSLQEAGREAAGNTERYRFGVYFYRENATPILKPKDDKNP